MPAPPAVAAAAAAAAGPQPLWALVPAAARARYLRRTAQAVLDELDDLAATLAAAARVPRTEALLAELLPSVAGLQELAGDGPPALADRPLGRHVLLRAAGRRATLFHGPAGVVGIRGGDASPWAEPVLEAAAALLAGNGVVLSCAVEPVGIRLASALGRAGVPDGLLQLVPRATEAELAAACDRAGSIGLTGRKGAMLLLDDAPLDPAVSAALWAAFSRAGQGPASVGRIVCVASVASSLLVRLVAAAQRLEVGDPADPETEVGPLASAEQAAAVEALVREAEAGGAVRLCGGRLDGARFAPVVLRAVPPGARILREPVPGPVLAVVEARSEEDAIELARPRPDAGGSPAISVWTAQRDHGERVARALAAELTWVNQHGVAAPAATVRLARHTVPRTLASQPLQLRSARWLPYDPGLVRASETAARLLHGRESERFAALRSGGPALARVAVRLAREALR
jgi:acyl-CoA reductase-like NAD-dependent aldehyde dehydrogenase